MRFTRNRAIEAIRENREAWDLIYATGLAVSLGPDGRFSFRFDTRRMRTYEVDAALEYKRARHYDSRVGVLLSDVLGGDPAALPAPPPTATRPPAGSSEDSTERWRLADLTGSCRKDSE